MAVALRELDRGRRRAELRLVPAPPRPPTPPGVFWLRRALVLLGAVLVVLGVAAGVRAVALADAGETAQLEMTVVVPAGQTLWDLAGRYAPEGRDRAEWARQVAMRNDLDPGAILPGTPVLIPIDAPRITADPQARSTR